MNNSDILAHCDHTQLGVTATWAQIQTLCDEGMAYHTASVCIPPAYVAQAAAYCDGRLPICTVIGFPNGYATTRTKVFEAADAVENGADELDMVVNVGWVKAGAYGAVGAEIAAVRAACTGKILKVIIEACLLDEEEKTKLCTVVADAGADFIKTSTGFSTGGATKEDVALLTAHAPSGLRVKAAGGISTLADAEAFLRLGADRLGTSRIVKLVRETEQK